MRMGTTMDSPAGTAAAPDATEQPAPHDWPRRTRGQSLVELALVLPVLLFFGLACVQFALIFRTYDDLLQVTRDAGRWVSVHPQVADGNTGVSDGTTIGTVRGRLPASIKTSRLQMAIVPACAAPSGGVCAGRTTGATIAVTSTYDFTDVLFLPTTFGWGSWSIRLPSTSLSYTITMQVEPS
jgi:Flp pilus assembly protein TadG